MNAYSELFGLSAKFAHRWRVERRHNRRLRMVLGGAALYAAAATLVAIIGWIR